MSYPVPKKLTNYGDPMLKFNEKSTEYQNGFFTRSTFKPEEEDEYNKSYKNDIDLLKRFQNYDLPNDPNLLEKKNIVVVDTGQRDWPRQPNAYAFTFSFGEKLGNTKGSVLQTPYYYNNPLIPYSAYESIFFNQTASSTGLINSAQYVNKYPKIIPGTSIPVRAPDGTIGEVAGNIYGWRRVIDPSGNLKHVTSDGTDTITSADIVEYYPVYNPNEPRGGFLGIDSSVQVLQNDNNAFSTQVKLTNVASIRIVKAKLPLRKVNPFKNTLYNTNVTETYSNDQIYTTVTVTDISSQTTSDISDTIVPYTYVYTQSRLLTDIIRSDSSVIGAGSPPIILSDGTTVIYSGFNNVYGATQYLNGLTAMFGLKSTLSLFTNGAIAQTSWNTISDYNTGIINVATHIENLITIYDLENVSTNFLLPYISNGTNDTALSQSNISNYTLKAPLFSTSINSVVSTLCGMEKLYYPLITNSAYINFTTSFNVAYNECVSSVSSLSGTSDLKTSLQVYLTNISSNFTTYKVMSNVLSTSTGFLNPSGAPYNDLKTITTSVSSLLISISLYTSQILRYGFLESTFRSVCNIMNFYTPLMSNIKNHVSNIENTNLYINTTNYSSASVITELTSNIISISEDYSNLFTYASCNSEYVSCNAYHTTTLNNCLFLQYIPQTNLNFTSLFTNIDNFYNRYSNIDYITLSNNSTNMSNFGSNVELAYNLAVSNSNIFDISAFIRLKTYQSNINNYYLTLVTSVSDMINQQEYINFYTDEFSYLNETTNNNLLNYFLDICNNSVTINSNLLKRKILYSGIDTITGYTNSSSEINRNSTGLTLCDTIVYSNNYEYILSYFINDYSKLWPNVDLCGNTARFSNTSGIFDVSGLLTISGTILSTSISNQVIQTIATLSSLTSFTDMKYFNILTSKNTTTEIKTVSKINISNVVYPSYSYEALDTFNNEPYVLMKMENLKGIYYGPTSGIQNAFAALVQTNTNSRNIKTDSLTAQYQDYQPWSQEAFIFDPPLLQLSNAIVTLVDPNDQQFSHIDDLNLIFIEFYPIDSPKFGKMKFYITKYTDESITNFGSETKMYNYFATNEIRVGDEVGFYSGNIQQILNDPQLSANMRIFFNFLNNQNVTVTDVYKVNVDSMYPLMDMAYAFDAVIKPFNLSNTYDIFSNMKNIIPEVQQRNITLATTCNILDYNGNTIYPYDNELYSNILVLQQYNVYSNIAITDVSDSSIQYPILYNSDYPFTKKETSTLTRYFEYKHPIPIINKHLQATFVFEVVTMVPDKTELQITKKK